MVVGTNEWLALDSYLTGLLSSVIVLLLFFSQKGSAALVLFGAGLILAVWISSRSHTLTGHWTDAARLDSPAWSDFV